MKVNSILQFPNYNSEAGEKGDREKGKKKLKRDCLEFGNTKQEMENISAFDVRHPHVFLFFS